MARTPLALSFTTLATALMLVACSPGAGSGADTEQAPDAGSDGAETGSEASDDASTGGGIDQLYSESLHDGVEPAAAGTVYIEIEGERLEFGDLDCRFTERDDGGALTFNVEAETAYGLTELAFVRNIGWFGFDYEEELVQVTHVGGTGGRELNDISMAQNGGDEEGGIEWYRGDGPDPMAQIVGTDVTAIGTLAGLPGAENPQEGDFVLAANCG